MCLCVCSMCVPCRVHCLLCLAVALSASLRALRSVLYRCIFFARPPHAHSLGSVWGVSRRVIVCVALFDSAGCLARLVVVVSFGWDGSWLVFEEFVHCRVFSVSLFVRVMRCSGELSCFVCACVRARVCACVCSFFCRCSAMSCVLRSTTVSAPPPPPSPADIALFCVAVSV